MRTSRAGSAAGGPAAFPPAFSEADSRPGRAPRWAAYVIAALAAAALGHFLLGLPIQVSDSFGNMQQLSASWSQLLHDQSTQKGFLRPFLWGGLKLVYDLSGGNFTPWYRWTHVLQGFLLAGLFVALVRPRTWGDVALLPFGLAVLMGLHTFSGTVVEAFPINTFMTLMILTFAAAVVALARYHWWNDVIAAVLFVLAALTVETGLLLWVVFVGAALTGARGVSKPGVLVVTALLAAYFYARFIWLDVGSPDLLERSSGFGFGVLDPSELVARFGANPLPFYAYNVAASLSTVLFSEPSSGVFHMVRALTSGSVRPAMIVTLTASIGVALLLARFAARRYREWLAGRFTHDDRLVLLFAMVLGANAVISYPYTKDTTMSTAGALLAVAAFAAVRHLVQSVPVALPRWRMVATVAAVLAVSCAWSLRTVGLFAQLRNRAFVERIDWAYIESDVAAGAVSAATPAARQLMHQLRQDALVRYPAPRTLALPFSWVMVE